MLLLQAAASLATPAERQQIAAERRNIERDFAAQEQACRQRFAVTGCVEDASARRRQALAPWREKELALDAADRRRRAAQRQAAIQARLQAASAAAASAPPVLPRTRKASTTPSTVLPAAPPAASPAQASAAAGRVKDAAARKAEAEAVQARVARRQAERAREGKVVTPLPADGGGASSAAP